MVMKHAVAATTAAVLMAMAAGAGSAMAAPLPMDALTIHKTPPPNPPPVQAWTPGQPITWVRSLPVDLAMRAAKAALAACRSKHPSVGVVDHGGNMIVMYIDDYATLVGQKALPQKLHATVIRQTASQELASHSAPGVPPETDWEATIINRFNEGALIQPGAVPIFLGALPYRQFLGAIAVSGTEPPGKGATPDNSDHACAMAGYNAIKDYLQ